MGEIEWPGNWKFEYEASESSDKPWAFDIDHTDYPQGATFSHRFELRAGDRGPNETRQYERTESAQLDDGDAQVEKTEWWYSWSFHVPKDFPDSEDVPKTAWQVHLGQFQQFPSVDPQVKSPFIPPWMFGKRRGGPFTIRRFPTLHLDKTSWWSLIDDDDFRGKWHDVYVHAKWSSGNDGFFKVWIGSKPKMEFFGPTCSANRGRIYFKYGIYRPMDAANKRAVVRFSKLRRGKTAADVGLPASAVAVLAAGAFGDTSNRAGAVTTGTSSPR